jgi:hypothetical protein
MVPGFGRLCRPADAFGQQLIHNVSSGIASANRHRPADYALPVDEFFAAERHRTEVLARVVFLGRNTWRAYALLACRVPDSVS